MSSKIKQISRKCLVCGRKINIKIYENKNYSGGHYFNKLKIPIGKGEYKKICITKLFGRKVDIVKWTGKEKRIEYWECDACYEEAMHENWLEQMIEKFYGKRCKDFEKGCPCCESWKFYDTIINSNRKRI